MAAEANVLLSLLLAVGRRWVAPSVGVDEDADQIITLLICVHQIFEINGSRDRQRITSFDRGRSGTSAGEM